MRRSFCYDWIYCTDSIPVYSKTRRATSSIRTGVEVFRTGNLFEIWRSSSSPGAQAFWSGGALTLSPELEIERPGRRHPKAHRISINDLANRRPNK